MIQGHLRRFPRFDGFTDDEIQVLERSMVARRYRPGQTLLREGDRVSGSSAAMYLVLEGSVTLTRSGPDGREETLRSLGPGELLGVIALLRDTRRTATCRIEKGALIASLDRLALERLFQDSPRSWAHLQRTLALQLAADFRAVHQRLSEAVESAPGSP